RADDAAVLPDLGHLRQIQPIRRLFEDLEALGVRLHHAVLDTVVDHLDEVTSAVRANQAVTAFGRQRFDRRLDSGAGLRCTTGHDRVALLEAPDAATGAAVDELEAARLDPLGALHSVFPPGVAAIHEQVAWLTDLHQLVQVLIGDLASWQHQPDVARRLDFLDQILKRRRTNGAVADRFLDRSRAAIEGDDFVPPKRQAVDHIAAHPAQADEAQLHGLLRLLCCFDQALQPALDIVTQVKARGAQAATLQ